MAKVTGKTHYGQKVTGEFNLFWMLAPVVWMLIVQPDLFSYTALGIIVAGFLIGVVLDFIAAFAIFALGANSR